MTEEQAEKLLNRLHFLESFHDVATAFIEDIFYRRKMGGQGNEALKALFELKMNGKGYASKGGSWEKVGG